MARNLLLIFVAALGGLAMWGWVQRVAIPHQQSEAVDRGIPRGNLSDLYPRWLGARELLLYGRDPYSPELAREAQAGYYGRVLDPNRPNDPKDQQAFAYPLYVVFVLAPTARMNFAEVQRLGVWLLLLITAASVPLWLRALGYRISPATKLAAILLVVGSFPAIQGIKLQQLTLLAAGLLAAAFAALAFGYLILAGALLALATIKPQLVALTAVWICFWALGNWRERRKLIFSFVASMLLLAGAGELLLPGWIGEFRRAMADYWVYTGGGRSVLDVVLTPYVGRAVAAALILLALIQLWRARHASTLTPEFSWSLALAMATTLVVIPMFAPYNQLLLVPALALIARSVRRLCRTGPASRFCLVLVAGSVVWPWIASAALVGCLAFLPAATVQRAWMLPLFTNFWIPISVLGLLLLGRATLCSKG
jgi:glycosyl transferase family 87